jgi:starch-binding outer membrane protein, SusD/RagB family
MRKTFLVYVALILGVLFVPMSCNQDFLDTAPQDRVSSAATWADGSLSQAFVFNVYAFLGYGGFEEQALASVTDEAMFTHSGRNINRFTEGSEDAGEPAWQSDTWTWPVMYRAIRGANVAIENLPKATFTDTQLKDRLLGEAHFLRAYYYHQLVRFYGGVPLVDKAYGLNEEYEVARSSYEDCTKFIVADCDKAAALLDKKPETNGRATKLAAQALKARQLAYAASDLHDAAKVRAKSSTLGGYANMDLIAYTTGTQAARWTAARDAAKVVLDAGKGYKMTLTTPESADAGRANYMSIAMGGESGVGDKAAAVELIFQRTHTALFTRESNWPLGGLHYGINNGPNGYNNWAGNTPIQQLVDDYEMMDGSKFDWAKADHAAAPYTNRDPRFYATILYDGATWKPRPSSSAALDPMNQIQSGTYDGKAGIDTRLSPIENWNGSRTGYYTRKFIDNNPAIADNQSSAQTIPWPFIRYTEMAFIAAEANLELGNEAEAKTWLNRIRFRAGMPAISETGAALKTKLQNERRVELAYEEHRYHDARRWMIGEQLGRPIRAINVTAKLKAGKTASTPYKFDRNTYDYTYSVYNNTENELRVWRDKMYFRPINRAEINRNKKLVQNPGY